MGRFVLRVLAFAAICPVPLMTLAVVLQLRGVRQWDVATQMLENPSYKRHLLETHLDAEVVVLGGSRALTGINSEVLADELVPVFGHRPKVLNLGVWAYDPRAVQELLGDLLPKLHRAKLVVYSATQRLLVDRPHRQVVPSRTWSLRPVDVQNALLGAVRSTPGGTGEARFHRFRAELAEPDMGDIGIASGEPGRWPGERAIERGLRAQAGCLQVENFAALEAMLDSLPPGAQRAIVVLPVSQAYLDAHRRYAPEARAAYLTRLGRLPSRLAATAFVDLSLPVDPELEWYEPDHLFAGSRPRLTRRVAAELRKTLIAGSAATPR